MNFISKKPKVIRSEIKNGRLVLTLDWFGIETTKAVVLKTSKGYYYEHVGLMHRELPHLDEIMDEIECHEALKEMIEKLPVININEEYFA